MSNIIFSEGSGVADSIFGKSQEPIKALIQDGVEAFSQFSAVDKVFNLQRSKNFAEKFTSETSLGDFADVGENGAYPKTSMQEGYSKTLVPTTWKSSFEVTQELVEDAKIGKIKSRASIFTTSYNRTREKFAAGLVANGTGATMSFGGKDYDTTAADGKPLFSTEHPSITGGTADQSNLFVGEFSPEIMDSVQEKMQMFTDDNGNLLNLAPDTIIIPNVGSLKRQVLAAVGSDLESNSANNAINFQAGLWNVIVWPYLPATLEGKPYFIMMDSQFKDNYECLPWLDRVSLTVKSDIDPLTDANVFKGRARFGAGFNNWRCMALCGGGVAGTSL